MWILVRSSKMWFVGVIISAAAPSAALASDELTAKVRTAWEKFSEFELTKANYGERANIALTMLEVERQRIQFDALAKELKVQIDSFPHRRTNLQEEVYQQWLFYCQERGVRDNNLAQLRLQWQELNEIAISEAQAAGKRVKPLDRPGLLNELQRLERERLAAFDAVKKVLPDAASAQGVTESAAFADALNEVGAATDTTIRLVPARQFSAAFKTYYNQQSSQQPRSAGRKGRRKGSSR
jgi:hypothetical protein